MYFKSVAFPVLLIFILAVLVLPALAMDQKQVTLKAGMPVFLKLTETISSEIQGVSDEVNLAVSKNVEVDGYIVIEQGTPASGSISMVEEAGRVGTSGKIYFTIDTTKAVNGDMIVLKSSLGQKGKDKETASVALGVVCCPLFLLMKGDEASYPVGTEFKGYLAQDYTFDATELKSIE